MSKSKDKYLEELLSEVNHQLDKLYQCFYRNASNYHRRENKILKIALIVSTIIHIINLILYLDRVPR